MIFLKFQAAINSDGGQYGTLLCVALSLNMALSDFHLVVLSLTIYNKRRVVGRRVTLPSHVVARLKQKD
jgi:hypothetical protein